LRFVELSGQSARIARFVPAFFAPIRDRRLCFLRDAPSPPAYNQPNLQFASSCRWVSNSFRIAGFLFGGSSFILSIRFILISSRRSASNRNIQLSYFSHVERLRNSNLFAFVVRQSATPALDNLVIHEIVARSFLICFCVITPLRSALNETLALAPPWALNLPAHLYGFRLSAWRLFRRHFTASVRAHHESDSSTADGLAKRDCPTNTDLRSGTVCSVLGPHASQRAFAIYTILEPRNTPPLANSSAKSDLFGRSCGGLLRFNFCS